MNPFTMLLVSSGVADLCVSVATLAAILIWYRRALGVLEITGAAAIVGMFFTLKVAMLTLQRKVTSHTRSYVGHIDAPFS